MNIRKTAIATAVLASVIGMTGCSDSNDDAKQVVAPPPTANPVGAAFSITLTDNKGIPLVGTAKVTLSGDGTKYLKQQTVAAASADLGPLTVTNGILNLLIDNGVSAEANEVVVTAVVESDGFTSTSTLIRIDPKDPASTNVAPVQLVKFSGDVNQEKDAVVFVDKTETVNNGQLANTVKVDTSTVDTSAKDTTALAGGGAEVEIDNTVQLQKADGTAVTGSSVSVKVNYFSNEPNGSGQAEASSLDSFPGGFDVESADVEGQANPVEDFSFVSAGFVAIDMTTDTGEAVKKFDKPITVTMKVPEDTIWNTEANDIGASTVPATEIGKSLNTIAGTHAGQVIEMPVWSYEESTGKWTKSANTATVTLDKTNPAFYANGAFIAKMNVTHLSYWNLDWIRTARCNPRYKKFDIFFSDGQTPNNLTYQPSLTSSGFSGRSLSNASDPSFLAFYNTPNMDVNLGIKINGENVIQAVRTTGGAFDTTNVNNGVYTGNLCNLDAIRLSKAPEDFTPFTPKVKVQSVCAQDETKVTSQPARVTLSGQRYSYSRNINQGETAVFPALTGESASLNVETFVNADGYGTKKQTFEFSPTNEELTVTYTIQCTVPTGGTGGTGSTGGSTGN